MCALDELGRSDVDKLQDRARRRRWYEGASPVVYGVFKLPVFRGEEIGWQPLIQRKARSPSYSSRPGLASWYGGTLAICVSGCQEAVIPLKLGGMVAKRAATVYKPGLRSSDWGRSSARAQERPTLERWKSEPSAVDLILGDEEFAAVLTALADLPDQAFQDLLGMKRHVPWKIDNAAGYRWTALLLLFSLRSICFGDWRGLIR